MQKALKNAFKGIDKEMAMNTVKIAKMTKKAESNISFGRNL